jgi:2,3-bisphosphoglycerate-dependent phosphoglycerate mutase
MGQPWVSPVLQSPGMSAEAPVHRITFLRHAESVGNAENRFQGHADFPLTERGRSQARDLSERWKSERLAFDGCIASPLLRARETAQIVAAALGIPLEFDATWKELDNGLIAGLNEEEASQQFPRPVFMTPYARFGRTGESRWEVFLRAGKGLQNLLDRPPGRYLVISHGGILQMALYCALSITPQADYTGPRFSFGNTAFARMRYEHRTHTWRMTVFDPGI